MGDNSIKMSDAERAVIKYYADKRRKLRIRVWVNKMRRRKEEGRGRLDWKAGEID